MLASKGDEGASDAITRGLDFLASCQLESGAVVDPVSNPLLAITRPESLSERELFHAMAGADIWNTVNTVALFKMHGRDVGALLAFIAPFLAKGEGLSYWSARSALCLETTSALARVAPAPVRDQLRRVMRRHALPGGRWASFILSGPAGYETYNVAPSVTAWVLLAMEASDPLRKSGLSFLHESLGSRNIWAAHPSFYGTPFYPSHLAALLLPRASVLDYALGTQDAVGGWAFGDPPSGPACVIPTSLALLTLEAFPPSAAVREAACRGRRFLLLNQAGSGAFFSKGTPDEVWYAGDVYATCLAVLALSQASHIALVCGGRWVQ